ncbi:cation diffusion facilitator family transporter [Acinetobacter haemolyticus]|uniref:cation diffusion facilitator family transporter n=1 Tax=Acinetobacter haemolyticus TaxID=29430 RepID=UPI001331E4AD|nr:cation diffusion facilitator family transporter [Acinetobacter haemolyticus]NAR78792.1 cation diffusion facilitator family transporter [Acinetobacter haemolyticus]NAS03928.1 cation diffusion facilitator family transporter [Acinetobacter haemolyticus]QHI33897.1 cation diffusion facilitator family transporter [Acinetobacter haemolyticus]
MSSHNHTQDHKHNHSEHDHNHDHSGHKHSHGNTHKHNHDHSGHHHGHGGHDHDHDHDHSHIPSNKKILTISFLLITIFMVVEFIGGFITNSLALISDAGHMLSDSVALGIALAAVFIGQKQITKNKTYGYQRFEILAAALNGITLVGIALYIFIEAILRFQQPQHIEVQGMLIVASIGLLINIIVAVMIFKGSDTEHDLNMRGAYLHVLSDLLGSIGAIAAALCIYFFGWTWADTLASVLVAILVLRSGYSVVVKASHVLMQGTPEKFDLAEIKETILQDQRIQSVHDLHIWSLTSKRYILSCHIVVSEEMSMQEVQILLHDLENVIQNLGIEHVTIQAETSLNNHDDIHHCIIENIPKDSEH